MDKVDWGLQIWTLITFAGLFALLSRFAFKPIRKILLEREEKIAQALSDADTARAEAQRILEENEKKLDSARDETRKIIDEGHKIVAQMKKESGEQAKRNADTVVKRAQADIEREVQKSLDSLKATIANISVNISRQYIKDNIDDKKHLELADDFIERLKKRNVSRR
jgi:F-type H+-transporting ATPase subunit b